ncbi:hypothetical protein HYT55_00050 [Candidatus Woesearchaeota archaeon]|nr:hypothetical protein [Candidatus Woesearchaeota archaeon]
MATVLDLSLLQNFSFIFPFIFVWAIVFAILQKTKATGAALGIDAIIATVVAFMSILSPEIILMINFMIPWFAIAIIFFILLLLLFRIFGAEEKHILSALTSDKSVLWVILGIGLVIVFAAFGNVFGQSFTEQAFQGEGAAVNATTGTTGVATASFQTNITSILADPKVLGMIILFAIAVFAIALLSGSNAR